MCKLFLHASITHERSPKYLHRLNLHIAKQKYKNRIQIKVDSAQKASVEMRCHFTHDSISTSRNYYDEFSSDCEIKTNILAGEVQNKVKKRKEIFSGNKLKQNTLKLNMNSE